MDEKHKHHEMGNPPDDHSSHDEMKAEGLKHTERAGHDEHAGYEKHVGHEEHTGHNNHAGHDEHAVHDESVGVLGTVSSVDDVSRYSKVEI